MPAQKSGSRTTSRGATSSAFSAASVTSKPNKSTILKSAFAPTHLQLSLFASTIWSPDNDQLRIHDTETGDLRSTYSTSRINCIAWGQSGKGSISDSTISKKRRKLDGSRSIDSTSNPVVIAIGTNQAEIELFSPSEGKVVAVLEHAHPTGTKDFAFEGQGSTHAWSLGVDGSLIQWDLSSMKSVQ